MNEKELPHSKKDSNNVKASHRNNRRPLLKCSICDADTHYSYYGALTCDPCRTFFRRQVVKRKVRRFYMFISHGLKYTS